MFIGRIQESMPIALKNYLNSHGQKLQKNNLTKAAIREQSIVSFKPRCRTLPTQEQTESTTNKSVAKYFQSKSRLHSVNVNLPRLNEQIVQKQQKILNSIYHKKQRNNKKKYELQPLKKMEPVRLMRRPSSSHSSVSYLSMASSRTKLTDQYFSQIDNMRLVERLLLVQPSKQLTKKEHKQFYDQHVKYKRHMQVIKTLPEKSIYKYKKNK